MIGRIVSAQREELEREIGELKEEAERIAGNGLGRDARSHVAAATDWQFYRRSWMRRGFHQRIGDVFCDLQQTHGRA